MLKKFPLEFKRDVVTVARRGDLTIPEQAATLDVRTGTCALDCDHGRRWGPVRGPD